MTASSVEEGPGVPAGPWDAAGPAVQPRRAQALQQPDWPDPKRLSEVVRSLEGLPPLVSAGECDQLKERLAAVARGEAFVLQGGDCAETFASTTADSIRGRLRMLLQMAVVLTYAASVPVVKARTRFSVEAEEW